MNGRMLLLGLVFASLLVAGVLRFVRGDFGTGDASAARRIPPEVPSSGGAARPVAGRAERPASFPVMRADTPALVREVLRITRTATRDDRSALRDAALHSDDPLVAGNALKALGRLGLFSDDPDLLAMMGDPRTRVRQDAVAASGMDGRREAVPALEAALARGDAAARPLVLEALGRIGGTAARELIARVAADPGAAETDRVFARSALERAP